MTAVGLLGGTFDPVHFGHLRPALEIMEALDLAAVRFVPNATPPHREQPVASAAQRLEMLRLAVATQPGFTVDDRELRRSGPSYTVDTLAAIREEVGDTPLCLLLGVDAFLSLPTWHRWQRLLDLAHLVVCHRPGWSFAPGEVLQRLCARHQTDDPQSLHGTPAGRLLLWPVTQLEISATAIRGHLRRGRSARFLLPEAVRIYLTERALYRGPATAG